MEACDFRDGAKSLAKKNTVVVGISLDKPTAQAKFKEKFDLPFTLLADDEKKIAEALWRVAREEHVRQEDDAGIVRSTFVIGPDGKIEKDLQQRQS